MLNVAAPIWNEVARQGTSSKFGAQFLNLDQDELTAAHQQEAERLEAQGNDPTVVSAYLQYAPLVAERDAVAKYRQANPQAATYLPELTSIQEALSAASREFHLSEKQTRQLRALLQAL